MISLEAEHLLGAVAAWDGVMVVFPLAGRQESQVGAPPREWPAALARPRPPRGAARGSPGGHPGGAPNAHHPQVPLPSEGSEFGLLQYVWVNNLVFDVLHLNIQLTHSIFQFLSCHWVAVVRIMSTFLPLVVHV